MPDETVFEFAVRSPPRRPPLRTLVDPMLHPLQDVVAGTARCIMLKRSEDRSRGQNERVSFQKPSHFTWKIVWPAARRYLEATR